ncbi:MAG: transglycosylase domain-containing protein, partial [Anaerolineales bacterium]|nr:transglycosylase domain-containing protein [Anaerolineales bacterium]
MPNAIKLVSMRRARRRWQRSGLRSLRQWFVGLLLVAAIAALAVTTVAAMFGLELYTELVSDLPSSDALAQAFEFSNNQFFQTTRIYDRSGQHLLYEVIDPRAGDRQWLALEQIPVRFQNATIAVEDKTFYQNPGYDVIGILRAFGANLSRPACVLRPESCPGQIQGGSTITQQLVKNVIIAPGSAAETSYARKFRESLIAREATERYSKERILEWYLNTNFYGYLAYGVDAAARVYFAKPAAKLNLAESALLAAIPQSPGLNPIDAPEAARQRQALVLQAMVEQGYVTSADARAALAEDVFARLQPASSRFNIVAPHFVFYVLNQAVDQLGPALVHRGGLRIVTTLDIDMQMQIECAARSHVDRLQGADPNYIEPAADGTPCAAAAHLPSLAAKDVGVDRNVSNVAALVLNPRTGEILSMLGSYDYWDKSIDGSFNVAVSGLRQPGSAFKPFTYLTAFSQGYTPASMVLDVRTAFPLETGISYVPENYDRSFRGPVSFRNSLAQSLNVPTVQVMTWAGVENVLRSAHRMGINTLDGDQGVYGPALTLGGGEVTLLDMVYAYGVFANSGVMAGQPVPDAEARSGFRAFDPVAILRIENNDGTVLSACGLDGGVPCEFTGPSTQPVLSPELAYL